eukprot:Tamp_35660.p1 GENE.Tamp_35660~~Tamp_35660.p1  ORF type:complete len:124 (-),score=1.10 Tamp_35660:75-446(-)
MNPTIHCAHKRVQPQTSRNFAAQFRQVARHASSRPPTSPFHPGLPAPGRFLAFPGSPPRAHSAAFHTRIYAGALVSVSLCNPVRESHYRIIIIIIIINYYDARCMHATHCATSRSTHYTSFAL